MNSSPDPLEVATTKRKVVRKASTTSTGFSTLDLIKEARRKAAERKQQKIKTKKKKLETIATERDEIALFLEEEKAAAEEEIGMNFYELHLDSCLRQAVLDRDALRNQLIDHFGSNKVVPQGMPMLPAALPQVVANHQPPIPTETPAAIPTSYSIPVTSSQPGIAKVVLIGTGAVLVVCMMIGAFRLVGGISANHAPPRTVLPSSAEETGIHDFYRN